MADVTLPEEDANTLARGMKLLQTLNNNPAARPLLERAIKAVDPSVRTTEEQVGELLAPQLAEMAAIKKTLEDDIAARKAERDAQATADVEARMNSDFDYLRTKEGLQDDGVLAVKQLMVDRNIADPMAAFALFQKQNPAADVSAPSYVPQNWDFERQAVDQDVDGLWKNADAWADRQVGHILTDMRKADAA